jgi:sugar/nucleoside kinase (ribokinase family)
MSSHADDAEVADHADDADRADRADRADDADDVLQVVVVGDIMVDVIVRLGGPLAIASDTPSAITVHPGGAAANQAVWLARGGVPTAMVAAIGSDPLGDAAIRELAAAGVSPWVVLVDGAPTGVVVALVDNSGQRSMLTDRGANLALTPGAVESALSGLEGRVHLHLSGYVLYDARSRAAGRHALEIARDRGYSVSIDACSAGPLAEVGADLFLGWASGADWLFLNREELAVLTGATDVEAGALSLATGVREVVLTLGADGVIVARLGEPAVRVRALDAAVADTTGAGDALSGTYLARRLLGEGIDAGLSAALHASAAVVASPGARSFSAGYSRE